MSNDIRMPVTISMVRIIAPRLIKNYKVPRGRGRDLGGMTSEGYCGPGLSRKIVRMGTIARPPQHDKGQKAFG